MYSLKIKNGTIVDGTGSPRFRGDIAIAHGRIAEIGKISSGAERVLDASDLVVAPGFIDQHTHYDAQVFWDPYFTSSSWHGVTSVVTGNCGFTLAPCRPENREYITRMLAVVEDMSLAALQAGLPWGWEDYRSFLAAIERRPKALNMGCLVGHSAIRRDVLGAGFRRPANGPEITTMQELTVQALLAGALGLSTSRQPLHADGDGDHVPSFYADMEELSALARAVGKVGRGIIEVSSKMVATPRSDSETGDLADLVWLAKTSGRPVTWASVRYLPRFPGRCMNILAETSKAIAEQGVRLFPQIGARPIDLHLNWHKLMPVFAHLPTWRKVMFLPAHEMTDALRDPAIRAAMRAELAGPNVFSGWQFVYVEKAKRPEHKSLEGQSITALAAAQGKDPLDAYLDLCIAEDCDTDFICQTADNSDQALGRMLKHPNTLLETDAGAHLSSICNADFPTYLLSHWVRDTGILSLEDAVARLTTYPADAFGLTDRGRIKPGFPADVVLFDPLRVGSVKPRLVQDLPANQSRLIREAEGIHSVIVNGEIVMQGTKPSGAFPGQVLKGA